MSRVVRFPARPDYFSLTQNSRLVLELTLPAVEGIPGSHSWEKIGHGVKPTCMPI